MTYMTPIKIGAKVLVWHEGKVLEATVKYFGNINGRNGEWVGVQLTTKDGDTNGTLKGRQYFTCPNNLGLFVRPICVRLQLNRRRSFNRYRSIAPKSECNESPFNNNHLKKFKLCQHSRILNNTHFGNGLTNKHTIDNALLTKTELTSMPYHQYQDSMHEENFRKKHSLLHHENILSVRMKKQQKYLKKHRQYEIESYREEALRPFSATLDNYISNSNMSEKVIKVQMDSTNKKRVTSARLPPHGFHPTASIPLQHMAIEDELRGRLDSDWNERNPLPRNTSLSMDILNR
ncbi:hypothetical protein SNEBB_004086 [Seison nebaliae]|nr:hypothetical protein SNEBB_004086 [Seison nebaliae]